MAETQNIDSPPLPALLPPLALKRSYFHVDRLDQIPIHIRRRPVSLLLGSIGRGI